MVRTGLVGYGLAGRVFHAPFLEADPAFSLDAVVTSDPVRAESVRNGHPHAAVLATFDHLLATAGSLDLVVLATPPEFHFDQARRALEAGLAVVVDKPFVLDSEQGERLIAIAEACGRPLTVFHNRRWDGDFRTVEAVIASGVLGDVYQFESAFEHWAPHLGGQWKDATPASRGGGVTFDLGSHLIDQALRLFGPVASVRADVRSVRDGAGNDDVGAIDLVHASGVRSNLRMNRLAAHPAARFRVLGSAGAFVSQGLDGQEPALEAGMRPTDPRYGVTPPERWGSVTTTGSAADALPVPMERGRYQDFYAGVARTLRTGADVPVSPESALEVTRLLEAILAPA